MTKLKQTGVAIGIIQDKHQKIFITERPDNVSFAGFWEFPGGKIEKNETPRIALARELLEETGIIVQHASLLKVQKEISFDRLLRLYFYLIEEWKGEPYGSEGQKAKWIDKSELSALTFPPANASIIAMLLSP